MKDKLKKLEIKFIGVMDWKKLKEFMILRLMECETEKEFIFLLKAILGSMFNNEKEIDEARKKIQIKMLSDIEKKQIKEFRKKKNAIQN